MPAVYIDRPPKFRTHEGWRFQWTLPTKAGDVVRAVVPGPFMQPRLVRALPYVVVSTCRSCFAAKGSANPVRRLRNGIPDPWLEYLAWKESNAVDNTHPRDIRLDWDYQRFTDFVWTTKGLPMVQGIPDPWKIDKLCECAHEVDFEVKAQKKKIKTTKFSVDKTKDNAENNKLETSDTLHKDLKAVPFKPRNKSKLNRKIGFDKVIQNLAELQKELKSKQVEQEDRCRERIVNSKAKNSMKKRKVEVHSLRSSPEPNRTGEIHYRENSSLKTQGSTSKGSKTKQRERTYKAESRYPKSPPESNHKEELRSRENSLVKTHRSTSKGSQSKKREEETFKSTLPHKQTTTSSILHPKDGTSRKYLTAGSTFIRTPPNEDNLAVHNFKTLTNQSNEDKPNTSHAEDLKKVVQKIDNRIKVTQNILQFLDSSSSKTERKKYCGKDIPCPNRERGAGEKQESPKVSGGRSNQSSEEGEIESREEPVIYFKKAVPDCDVIAASDRCYLQDCYQKSSSPRRSSAAANKYDDQMIVISEKLFILARTKVM